MDHAAIAPGAFRLHWSPKSPYVRKVMIAAHELDLADRLDLVRSVASMSCPNPQIMQDNPLNKIPTLVCPDGQVIQDSVVICEFLDFLSGKPQIFPPAGPQRWKSLSLHAHANGLLDILILWRNEREKPPEQQTEEWLAAFALKAEASLDQFESQVSQFGQWPLCIGQIGLFCMLGYLDFRFPALQWRVSRPKLAQWFALFAERPSARATQVGDD